MHNPTRARYYSPPTLRRATPASIIRISRCKYRSFTDTMNRLRTAVRVAPDLRRHLWTMWRSYKQWRDFSGWRGGAGAAAAEETENQLWKYFSEHKEGRGIWKLNHYFEAYERHFRRFRGREVHALEIGVYSAGSLDMWRSYFGPQSHIYGVDIEPACKAYDSDDISVFMCDPP